MATLSVNMYRVRTTFLGLGGQPWLHTFYYTSATFDATSAQQSVDGARDFWAAMKSSMVSSVTWTVSGTVDEILDTTGGLLGSLTVTARSDGGSATGDMLPPAIQGLIRWDTGVIVRGKRLRGHSYLPGSNETQNGSTGLPAGNIIANAAAAVTAGAFTPTPDLLVWSRPNAVKGYVGQAHPVIAGSFQPQWAVLRSRRD